MCAIYGDTYDLDTLSAIGHLVVIADFYRALPIVSITTFDSIADSPLFSWHKNKEPIIWSKTRKVVTNLILVAIKLRRISLYYECFLHLVGLMEEDGLDTVSKSLTVEVLLEIVIASKNVVQRCNEAKVGRISNESQTLNVAKISVCMWLTPKSYSPK